MIKIFAIQINKHIDYSSLKKLLPFLPAKKQKRIKNFVHQADATRSLLGEWIIRFILCSRYKLSLPEILVKCDEYGKPFLENHPELFFNISHSGEWVVCALSEKSVGVDVEKIAPIDMEIACHYFARPEYLELMELQGKFRLEHFYTLWTLKESYLKALGKGLALDLDSIIIANFPGNNKVFQPNAEKDFYFSGYDFHGGYKLSACGKEKHFCKEIEILEYVEIAISAKIY